MEIFSLGTSNRTKEEFLEILKNYKINLVVDVRHFPTSRLFPHFQKENLEKFLKEQKIEYFHLKELGGFREGGYENYMKTKEFEKGLKKLIELLSLARVAIICAEKFPWKCHRAFISQKLEEFGIKTIHILEKEKIWEPKKQPKKIKPKCQKIKPAKND